MPNYAETNVERNHRRTRLVGQLIKPFPQQEGTPWEHASVAVRSRVYAIRVPRGDVNKFVTIDGNKVQATRYWMVTQRYIAAHLRYVSTVLVRQPNVMMRGQTAAPEFRNRYTPRIVPVQSEFLPTYNWTQAAPVELWIHGSSTIPVERAEPRPLESTAPDVAVNQETPQCSYCLDELACTVWTGCGHRTACFECASRIGERCPTCNAHSTPIRIYDP
jgi:hypothetical protein